MFVWYHKKVDLSLLCICRHAPGRCYSPCVPRFVILFWGPGFEERLVIDYKHCDSSGTSVLRGTSLCVDRAPPDAHGASCVCGRTCRGKGATRGGALGGDEGVRGACVGGVEGLVTMDPAVGRADGGTLIVRVDVHRVRLMLS